MTTQEALTLQHHMITKAREVAQMMGPNVTPIEAALIALEAWSPPPAKEAQVLTLLEQPPTTEDAQAKPRILAAAAFLDQEQCGFTIPELACILKPVLPSLSPQIVGKALRDSGYFRKQIRRDGERPLVWFCDYTYDLYNPQHP